MQYMSTGGTVFLGDHEIRADRVDGQTGVLKNLSHVAQRGLSDGKNVQQRMQEGIVSQAQPHTSAGLKISRFKKIVPEKILKRSDPKRHSLNGISGYQPRRFNPRLLWTAGYLSSDPAAPSGVMHSA